jgi:hypothetical protein
MKKLTFLLALFVLLSFSLPACDSSEPDVTPDPALAEQTPQPTATPEPTPPPCEHDWIAADCDSPETCSKCGEAQGVQLEHDWKAANYQEPEICLLCGAIEGTPLTPAFVLQGIELYAVQGVQYPFVTITHTGEHETTGEITLVEVSTSDYFEDIKAKEGYEFITAKFVLTFSDNNAGNYGVSHMWSFKDYYNCDFTRELIVSNEKDESDIAGFYISDAGLNFYGEDIDLYYHEDFNFWWSGRVLNGTQDWTFLVPIGYDGIVVIFQNGKYISLEDATIADALDDNTLFFRLRS